MLLETFALLAALVPADPSKAKADLDRRVATPLSPGAVALLGPDAAQPAVVGRLAEALRDPGAKTRAAAARVIAVTSLGDLQKSVEDALDVEADPEAAREEIRTLAALTDPAHDERLLAAADRFEGRLDPDLARILARQRGRGALPYLLGARRWNLKPTQWADAVWLAARGNAETLVPAIARALGTGDRQRWDALLRLLVRRNLVAGRNVVVVGLQSAVPGVAARAAWYFTWVREKEPLDSDRALREQWEPPEGADLDTAYLFDLVRRTFADPPGDTSAWMASLDTAKTSVADDIGPGSPWLAVMTPAERDALRRRYDRRQRTAPDAAQRARTSWDAPAKKPVPKPDYGFVLRTVSGLPRGVPADTLKVGGCRLGRGQTFGFVAVMYGPDGRPRSVRPYETGASRACEGVALALVTMTLAPDDEFPIGTRPDVLFGVVRSDCLAALEEPDVCPSVCPEDADTVLSVGGDVEPPVLEDRVEPRYPESLRRAGKQGVVTIEAVIATEGCVREVRVTGPVDPGLDVEAARAVAQWKYGPARLLGKPVSVFLTVTVTFRLH
jgi:TonB family protein